MKELLKRGAKIRVLARKQPGRRLKLPSELDGRVERHCGVDNLANAVVPDELTQGLIAYDLARAEAEHIVYHSVFRVDHFKDVPHFASKLAIENALREFDVPYGHYPLNYFSQNDSTV